MSLTLAEMRHKRSWARGAITKVANQLKIFQDSKASEIDLESAQKQIDALSKVEEVFDLYHQAIFDQEGDGNEAQFQAEQLEHQRLLSQHRRGLQAVINTAEAFELVECMNESLDAMERSAGRDHCDRHEAEVDEARPTISSGSNQERSLRRPRVKGVERSGLRPTRRDHSVSSHHQEDLPTTGSASREGCSPGLKGPKAQVANLRWLPTEMETVLDSVLLPSGQGKGSLRR